MKIVNTVSFAVGIIVLFSTTIIMAKPVKVRSSTCYTLVSGTATETDFFHGGAFAGVFKPDGKIKNQNGINKFYRINAVLGQEPLDVTLPVIGSGFYDSTQDHFEGSVMGFGGGWGNWACHIYIYHSGDGDFYCTDNFTKNPPEPVADYHYIATKADCKDLGIK